ncbi:MAG: type II secretion system protein, partial [bacterium]|nr:type II secretion system protein [bacterium]
MKKYSGSRAFTLAEVLITLAIIGVVAAVSIPSVISNSQQQEFKTGLRKAVSVLNSAITMNMAIDGESPYDNKDLPRYLMRHMSVLKTTHTIDYYSFTKQASGNTMRGESNGAFYTTDGMRFEFNHGSEEHEGNNKLHESDQYACTNTNSFQAARYDSYCAGCGSLGLNSNPNNTTLPPCLILVDVNGDKKPTPGNVNCKDE